MIILLVDDSVTTLDGFRVFLEAKGHLVHTTSCGAGALSVLRECKHDVIVLDHKLPAMSGSKFFETLRHSGDETPVIFLTAVTGSELDELAAFVRGFNKAVVIQKPVDPERLLSLIESVKTNCGSVTERP
jgi:DNA-binding response OmpR family regulator